MAYTLSNFSREDGVTDAILSDFESWHALLLKWNAKINLVSKTALKDFWQRHALDSLQVTRHVPNAARSVLDLGSGGGFPALAIAIAAKHSEQDRRVTLVESAGKKANFLRTVIRELSLPACVISERAENLPSQAYDIISARAFAPLPQLLTYAAPFWAEHTEGLFLKGQSALGEIIEAQQNWGFSHDLIPSKSDPDARLLKITHLHSNI